MAMPIATATNQQFPSLSAAVVLYHSSLEQLEALLGSLDKAAQSIGADVPLYLVDQSQSAVYSEAVSHTHLTLPTTPYA